MDYGDGKLNGIYQFNTKYRKSEVCGHLTRVKQTCSAHFKADDGATAPPPADLSTSGSWRLVRRVKPGNSWHPATDQLAGKDSYWTACGPTDACTFSTPWSSSVFKRFCFATAMEASGLWQRRNRSS